MLLNESFEAGQINCFLMKNRTLTMLELNIAIRDSIVFGCLLPWWDLKWLANKSRQSSKIFFFVLFFILATLCVSSITKLFILKRSPLNG